MTVDFFPGGGGAPLITSNPWLWFGVAVAAYALVVLILYVRGYIAPDRTISLFGPALMIRTRRGRGLLERLGRFKRFWSFSADIGIALAAIAMAGIVVVLVIDAIIATSIPASAAPSPSEALGLPGINPFIPLGYGLVALVVGVVLHEVLHGVVARSQGIPVKSLGILWLVVPVGAFVEQDDEVMTKASRRRRDRVAAAGVLANFALAAIFFVAMAALVAGTVQPNATGVGIVGVVAGTPAANASLGSGDIITSLNGTPTPSESALVNVLSAARPNETIAMSYYSSSAGGMVSTTVRLTSLESYTHSPSDSQKAFLGVQSTFLTPTQLVGVLTNPFASSSGPLIGATDWVVLPLAGLEPVQGSTQSFYHLSGPLAGMGPGTFWIVVNILYWLAWIDLLLGVSNALPIYPLDGGLLFRDFSATIASRVKRSWDEARLDRFSGRALAAASVVVLILFLWQFVVPRL